MQPIELFALRKKWFNLQAKDFITRYFMGVVILVIFLPGVAVGDNFNTLLAIISKPLTLLSQLDSSMTTRLISFVLLAVVFVVWTRAQRLAIKGGEFAVFQESLSIDESIKKSVNIKMLLIGNHFLWPFLLASFFYLPDVDNQQWLVVTRNIFLVLLLLLLQYISIFRLNRRNVTGLLFLSLVFILPIGTTFETLRMFSAFGIMLIFLYFQLHKEQSRKNQIINLNFIPTKIFSNNFYLQIVFKSGLTSSLLRMAIVAGLFIGFAFAFDYWVDDYQELAPYYLVLEAVLAYFISGFYVSFLDQRNTMSSWLITLPIKHRFWFFRDVFAVLLLTVLLHAPFYLWASKFSNVSLLAAVFTYHFSLLVLCYPIRILVTEKQTFITFVVLFIITAIALFNLS